MISKRTIYLLILILSAGCNTLQQETTTDDSISANPADIADSNKIMEYLDGTRLKINDKFPLATSSKNIETLVGKPDSTVEAECTSGLRDQNSKIAHYGLTTFEAFKDSLQLGSIHFKGSNLFLQYGKLKLNQNTTFTEIQKLFPVSSENVEKMNVYGIKGDVDSITISPSNNPRAEGKWILMFQKGKLIRIDNWFPC
jgi:hypothetical protein